MVQMYSLPTRLDISEVHVSGVIADFVYRSLGWKLFKKLDPREVLQALEVLYHVNLATYAPSLWV